MTDCFHCGLPADGLILASIDGEAKAFCCVACRSVAQAIAAGGLSQFYRYRENSSARPDESPMDTRVYDHAQWRQDFVRELGEGHCEISLSIAGISCAACAWLIEHHLQGLPGVTEVRVNVTQYRARVQWLEGQTKLSAIIAALAAIGYQAVPHAPSALQQQWQRSTRTMLIRLGVAGIGMMQVGMYAIALHAGAVQDMDTQWQHFFRWVSLLVATPVVLFSAAPFFSNSLQALKQKKLIMDVPVALAIGLAYLASIYATARNTGEVYFDSISMFTFFLLLGRYVELRVRRSRAFAVEHLSQLLPPCITRVDAAGETVIPLRVLQPGDTIVVQAGDVIACDGEVVSGASAVDESMLTGEAEPQGKRVGSPVFAGTHNTDSRLLVRCLALGHDTQLAAVEALFERALTTRPQTQSLADRVAGVFIFAVLLLTAAVGIFWYLHAPEHAFWIMLSVLVATCPCALSLATPTALTAGTLALRRLGVLVASADFMENVSAVSHCVLDKTGTLTEGKMKLQRVICRQGESESESALLACIAALESASRHPIALAFAEFSRPALGAENVQALAGQGVSGDIDGHHYRFGKREFACDDATLAYPGEGLWQCLSRDGEWLAWVLLRDGDRAGIEVLLSALKARGIQPLLLSGDRRENVEQFAARFDLPWRAQQSPEDKLRVVQDLQGQGARVLMLGDGINDVPVLGGADVSIAMGAATRIAQTRADAILLNNQLPTLSEVFVMAARVRAKVRQNVAWAVGYNLCILPVAAAGWLPPYLAAIGMSASSVLVVLNAARLQSAVKPLTTKSMQQSVHPSIQKKRAVHG